MRLNHSQISVRVRWDILSTSRPVLRNVGQRHCTNHNGVHGRAVRGYLSSVHGAEHVETFQSCKTNRHYMDRCSVVCHTAGERTTITSLSTYTSVSGWYLIPNWLELIAQRGWEDDRRCKIYGLHFIAVSVNLNYVCYLLIFLWIKHDQVHRGTIVESLIGWNLSPDERLIF